MAVPTATNRTSAVGAFEVQIVALVEGGLPARVKHFETPSIRIY